MNETMKKNGTGEYEYKGYTIYRTTTRRDAYNPWRISLSGRCFATLAEAREYIDAKGN